MRNSKTITARCGLRVAYKRNVLEVLTVVIDQENFGASVAVPMRGGYRWTFN